MVKNLPVNAGATLGQETSLCREDPLEAERATRSSILAWSIRRTEEPGGLHSMGLQRVRHNWATEHTQVLNKVKKFILSPCCMSMRYTKISSCTSPLGALSLFYWQGGAPYALNIQCPHATMFSLTQPSWYQSWKEWELPFIEGFDVLALSSTGTFSAWSLTSSLRLVTLFSWGKIYVNGTKVFLSKP